MIQVFSIIIGLFEGKTNEITRTNPIYSTIPKKK